MRTHFPWKELGYAAGFVCLLVALYVGTYFATVTRVSMAEVVIENPGVPLGDDDWPFKMVDRVHARYSTAATIGADWSESLFGPIHQIDRGLRPEFWKDQFLARPMPDPEFVK